MLSGRVVGLREKRREDVEALFALDADPEHVSLASLHPFVPRSLPARQADYDRRQSAPDATRVTFVIQRLDDEHATAVGELNIGQIDPHHRTASVGLSLLASARGQGLGRDALAVACRYGFEFRGWERLSLATYDVNAAMRATAVACGFVEEGRLRGAAWYLGRRVDEMVYGLLADEWRNSAREGRADETVGPVS